MHNRNSIFTTLIIALLLTPISQAAWADNDLLQTQRQHFLAAEKALKQGQLARYKQLDKDLRDYPLYPYLQFQVLNKSLSSLTGEQAREFLSHYRTSPLASQFRRIWLDETYRRQDWKQYLEFYHPTKNKKRQCHHLQVLLKTGHTELALDAVNALWLTGRSLPDACDPVLATWRQAGRLTPKLVWARIDLALQARRPRLAGYLGRYLPSDQERGWLDRWLELHQSPERLLSLKQEAFRVDHPYRQKILLHGLKRLARKDSISAVSAWQQLNHRFPFTEQEHYQAKRALVMGMINHGRPDLLQQLASLAPRQEDTRLLELRIRTGLKHQVWNQVLTWIDDLPPALAEAERWRYWKARALEQRGRPEDAVSIYTALADNRSYYGFLAADQLDKPYNLSHTPLEVPSQQVANIAASDGVRRARELYRLGRLMEARREWRMATASLNDEQLQAASKLAQSWGWHTQAIFTLAKTGYWEDLELRFPIQHRQVVKRASSQQQLDNAWVFAVIRQESAFASDAHSSAGAMGLMQLMPRTARQVAKRLKKRSPKRRDLMTPATNIDLGTAYLSQVLGHLNDNPVLATSAYNAGPHRVRQWLPEQASPADLWIETIPFRETRRYTQRVLTYAVIYDQRLGQKPDRIATRMPEVQPRQVATASREKKPVGQSAPPG